MPASEMCRHVRLGLRVRFHSYVERYPHFMVAPGAEGTVSLIETVPGQGTTLAVALDDPPEGAADWDGEVHFYGFWDGEDAWGRPMNGLDEFHQACHPIRERRAP